MCHCVQGGKFRHLRIDLVGNTLVVVRIEEPFVVENERFNQSNFLGIINEIRLQRRFGIPDQCRSEDDRQISRVDLQRNPWRKRSTERERETRDLVHIAFRSDTSEMGTQVFQCLKTIIIQLTDQPFQFDETIPMSFDATRFDAQATHFYGDKQ